MWEIWYILSISYDKVKITKSMLRKQNTQKSFLVKMCEYYLMLSSIHSHFEFFCLENKPKHDTVYVLLLFQHINKLMKKQVFVTLLKRQIPLSQLRKLLKKLDFLVKLCYWFICLMFISF